MKRSKPLRRTPLNRIGKKRKKEGRIYSKLGKDFLEYNPYCMAYGTIMVHFAKTDFKAFKSAPRVCPLATEIHHMKKPRCKYLNDTSTWLAVCRWSHDFIENNKSVARQLGLLQ